MTDINIYTVSFFGHRSIDDPLEAEKKLDRILCDLISTKEYVEFLIGREGQFDILASSSIKRAIKKYSYGNTSFVLVLPYLKAEYRDNEKYYLDYYDEIEICDISAKSHYKSAIQIRNRSMVDRSDLVICYVKHKSSGAYKTITYAEKQKRNIINIANQI